MGPAGSGKTTVGILLAKQLSWEFADADDFHSPANKEKMSRGVGLSDEDRIPWLQTIRKAMERWLAERRRSEEHTSELQSHSDLVCRLLLEKKKKKET